MHVDEFHEDESQGKLDDKCFVFKPYFKDNETLPSSFSIQVYVCKNNFVINFTKIDGLLNNPSINSNLYLGDQNSNVQLQDSTASVDFNNKLAFYKWHYFYFKVYASYEALNNEGGFATVILNTDLNELGLKPTFPFRVVS